MSWELASSHAIVTRAGFHVNSDAAASAAILEEISSGAMAQVCEACDYDFITNEKSIDRQIIQDVRKAVACLAANDLVAYDPTGYQSAERDFIADINNNNFQKIIGSLRNRLKKFKKLGA